MKLRHDKYILDADGEPVPCIGLLAWAEWMQTADRRVALDYVGTKRVSTVFLGLDHNWGEGPALLFETMVFQGEGFMDEQCHRYATRAEALAGHAATVAELRGVIDEREAS